MFGEQQCSIVSVTMANDFCVMAKSSRCHLDDCLVLSE